MKKKALIFLIILLIICGCFLTICSTAVYLYSISSGFNTVEGCGTTFLDKYRLQNLQEDGGNSLYIVNTETGQSTYLKTELRNQCRLDYMHTTFNGEDILIYDTSLLQGTSGYSFYRVINLERDNDEFIDFKTCSVPLVLSDRAVWTESKSSDCNLLSLRPLDVVVNQKLFREL